MAQKILPKTQLFTRLKSAYGKNQPVQPSDPPSQHFPKKITFPLTLSNSCLLNPPSTNSGPTFSGSQILAIPSLFKILVQVTYF